VHERLDDPEHLPVSPGVFPDRAVQRRVEQLQQFSPAAVAFHRGLEVQKPPASDVAVEGGVSRKVPQPLLGGE